MYIQQTNVIKHDFDNSFLEESSIEGPLTSQERVENLEISIHQIREHNTGDEEEGYCPATFQGSEQKLRVKLLGGITKEGRPWIWLERRG